MKNITIILNILVMSLLVVSCDSLLDVTPGSDMTDDGFWKSETDLKGACNRLYQQLSASGHDTRSDEIVPKSAGDKVSNGSRSAQDASEGDWKDPYDRIFLANNIIEKASASPVNEKVRDRYIAEALFFRAYYHFELVRKYGDVPLVTKVFTSTNDPDLKMPRTPREEVIQKCYSDLEFAAGNLPTYTSTASITDEFDRRRVTRSSALGLIVRIGLYEGTMQKNHKFGADYKAHLKKSIDAFELLNQEGHALFANFQGLFFEESNSLNKEIIFAKAYGPNGTSGAGSTNHSYSGDCEGSYALSRKMVDLFLYSDGLPYGKTIYGINETSFNDVVKNRDPRLLLTIWTINDAQEADPLYGWIATGKNVYKPFDAQRPMGYQLKKSFAGSRWGASRDYTDRLIIRWGEMLISYAEALYEHNNEITDAQLDATVNKLRDRVGFGVHLTNSFVTSNGLNMRDEIHRERTVELMAEGRRYDDLIRWKTAEIELPQAVLGSKFRDDEASVAGTRNDQSFANRLTDSNGKVKDNGQLVDVFYGRPTQEDIYVLELPSSRRFDPERDYYYPIPAYEIAHSDGNVKQNPKW